MGNPTKMELFMPSRSRKIRKQVPLAMLKCWQRTMHERYGLSFNMEEMASGKSLVMVKGLFQLGSSYNEVLVLPSTKRLRHFFTVEWASTSVSETDLSSAAIAEARKPLSMSVSVRKRMAARGSRNVLNFPNVHICINVLKTSAGVEMVGARKIFEKNWR
jgi:hypothetical protein